MTIQISLRSIPLGWQHSKRQIRSIEHCSLCVCLEGHALMRSRKFGDFSDPLSSLSHLMAHCGFSCFCCNLHVVPSIDVLGTTVCSREKLIMFFSIDGTNCRLQQKQLKLGWAIDCDPPFPNIEVCAHARNDCILIFY